MKDLRDPKDLTIHDVQPDILGTVAEGEHDATEGCANPAARYLAR